MRIDLMMLLSCAALGCAASANAQAAGDEAALRALDARQREAVASGDVKALSSIFHPNFRVNAPSNRVLTGQQVIEMVASGEIASESFERTPETVVVTGDVGVVMGSESVLPTATSEQARMYGKKLLKRRYTNVYLRENGVWRHLVRHANVIP